MILDEPLTAMIPPPDLWGSTGYTANNNKVGLKIMFLLNHYIPSYSLFTTGVRGAGGGLEQGVLGQKSRGKKREGGCLR